MKSATTIAIIILIIPFFSFSADLKFFDETIKILAQKSYSKKSEFELRLYLIKTFKDKLNIPIHIIKSDSNSAVLEYNSKKIIINNSNFNATVLTFENDIQRILSMYKLGISLDEYLTFLVCSVIDSHIFLTREPYIENRLFSELKLEFNNDFLLIEDVNKRKVVSNEEVKKSDTIIKLNEIPIKYLTYSLFAERTKNDTIIKLESKQSKIIRMALKTSQNIPNNSPKDIPILKYEITNKYLVFTANDYFYIDDIVEKQLKKIARNKKEINNIIIDLRNCNGGLLQSIRRFSEFFIDGNILLYTMKMKEEVLPVTSAKNGKFYGIPLKILTNKNTLGGAELLCYILKNNSNVQIIGTRTIGRGYTYHTYPILTNNYIIQFKTGELILPNGNTLNNNGLIPDIEYEKDDILEFIKK